MQERGRKGTESRGTSDESNERTKGNIRLLAAFTSRCGPAKFSLSDREESC